MRRIIRGDGFAGGTIQHSKLSLWEKWDVREIKEGFIGIYPDEFFVSPENDRLVHLLFTPTYINLN